MKTKLAIAVGTLLVAVLTACFVHIRKQDALIRDFLCQQGRYERLLDSTAKYVEDKYGEYLPDTYWEHDVYTCLYEDMDCWTRSKAK